MKRKSGEMLKKAAVKVCAVTLVALSFLAFGPAPAYAYIGPGAGITAIGTVLALIAAVLLAIIGFLWYPIKRMMRKRRENEKEVEATDTATKDSAE